MISYLFQLAISSSIFMVGLGLGYSAYLSVLKFDSLEYIGLKTFFFFLSIILSGVSIAATAFGAWLTAGLIFIDGLKKIEAWENSRRSKQSKITDLGLIDSGHEPPGFGHWRDEKEKMYIE